MIIVILVIILVIGYHIKKALGHSFEDKSPTFTELESRRLNK